MTLPSGRWWELATSLGSPLQMQTFSTSRQPLHSASLPEAITWVLRCACPYWFQPTVSRVFVSTTEDITWVLCPVTWIRVSHCLHETLRGVRLQTIGRHRAALYSPHNFLVYGHLLHFLKVSLALSILQNDICELIINWSIQKNRNLKRKGIAWGEETRSQNCWNDFVCTYTRTQTHMRTHIHTHTHMYTHMHTHTYIHILMMSW